MRRAYEWARDLLEPERNREWLYGVTEAALYAAVGFGIINSDEALLLLGIPAAVLGVARRRVHNPQS